MLTRPDKDEGASARDASPLFATNQPCNCDVEQAEVKRRATATAKLAMAGYSLVQLQAGSYLVGRWTSSKELADLFAVEQFLRRVSP